VRVAAGTASTRPAWEQKKRAVAAGASAPVARLVPANAHGPFVGKVESIAELKWPGKGFVPRPNHFSRRPGAPGAASLPPLIPVGVGVGSAGGQILGAASSPW